MFENNGFKAINDCSNGEGGKVSQKTSDNREYFGVARE